LTCYAASLAGALHAIFAWAPPIGATHRIENPGKVPLHIVEVQSGSYLGEDDIVRFDDIYGRQGTST